MVRHEECVRLDPVAGQTARIGHPERVSIERLGLELVIPGIEEGRVEGQHPIEPGGAESGFDVGRLLIVELGVEPIESTQLSLELSRSGVGPGRLGARSVMR